MRIKGSLLGEAKYDLLASQEIPHQKHGVFSLSIVPRLNRLEQRSWLDVREMALHRHNEGIHIPVHVQ